jgi:hypothetical protein
LATQLLPFRPFRGCSSIAGASEMISQWDEKHSPPPQ